MTKYQKAHGIIKHILFEKTKGSQPVQKLISGNALCPLPIKAKSTKDDHKDDVTTNPTYGTVLSSD